MILLACQTPLAPPAAPPVVEASWSDIAASYPASYRLAVSAEVPEAVWMLCRMPIVGVDLPHHIAESPPDTRITVYANETAWPAMRQAGARTFPAGSVIVKEKQGGDLGVMRKRAAGWEYAYISAEGVVESNQAALSACSSCHRHGTVPGDLVSGAVVLQNPRDEVFLSAQ